MYPADEQCLQFITSDEKTWSSAQKFCYDRGAGLMTIETPE